MPANLHVMFVALAIVFHMVSGQTVPTVGCGVCETGWISQGAKCYRTIDSMHVNWFNAQKFCEILGGGLAIPENQAELDFIRTLAESKQLGAPWIGVFDVDNDRRWTRIDGLGPAIAMDWGDGEPNNYEGNKEDCVWVDSHKTYKWNDGQCTEHQAFICQKASL